VDQATGEIRSSGPTLSSSVTDGKKEWSYPRLTGFPGRLGTQVLGTRAARYYWRHQFCISTTIDKWYSVCTPYLEAMYLPQLFNEPPSVYVLLYISSLGQPLVLGEAAQIYPSDVGQRTQSLFQRTSTCTLSSLLYTVHHTVLCPGDKEGFPSMVQAFIDPWSQSGIRGTRTQRLRKPKCEVATKPIPTRQLREKTTVGCRRETGPRDASLWRSLHL
jgi:hypothetical protein